MPQQRNLYSPPDFKPGNVSVAADGRAKVLDFDIVCAALRWKRKSTALMRAASAPSHHGLCHLREMLRGAAPSYSDDVYKRWPRWLVRNARSRPTPLRAALGPCKFRKGLKPKRIEAFGATVSGAAANHALGSLQQAQQQRRQPIYCRIYSRNRTATFGENRRSGCGAVVMGAGWSGYQQYCGQKPKPNSPLTNQSRQHKPRRKPPLPAAESWVCASGRYNTAAATS